MKSFRETFDLGFVHVRKAGVWKIDTVADMKQYGGFSEESECIRCNQRVDSLINLGECPLNGIVPSIIWACKVLYTCAKASESVDTLRRDEFDRFRDLICTPRPTPIAEVGYPM